MGLWARFVRPFIDRVAAPGDLAENVARVFAGVLVLSAHREDKIRRLAAPDIAARKGGEPLVCLTAYTAPVAPALDDACDLLLVVGSLRFVVHRLPTPSAFAVAK